MEPLLEMNNCDLWYSADDDTETGKGHYWQEGFGEMRTSQSFLNQTEAVASMNNEFVDFKGAT